MRTIPFIAALLLMTGVLRAQQRPLPDADLQQVTVQRNSLKELNELKLPVNGEAGDMILQGTGPVHISLGCDPEGYSEEQIGTTRYDHQANGTLSNRITMFDDGAIGAVWTMGFQEPSFPDRGTGYNYSDGTSWGPLPTQRIESVRTGWPTYAQAGPS
ncbi:MAG: hypothetical protein JW861_14015, partial [Bacteroidales bacterium]|nr:hypothetical protein [Bacteroidales bacterium]